MEAPALTPGSFRSRLADLASEHERLEDDHRALLAEHHELKLRLAATGRSADDTAETLAEIAPGALPHSRSEAIEPQAAEPVSLLTADAVEIQSANPQPPAVDDQQHTGSAVDDQQCTGRVVEAECKNELPAAQTAQEILEGAVADQHEEYIVKLPPCIEDSPCPGGIDFSTDGPGVGAVQSQRSTGSCATTATRSCATTATHADTRTSSYPCMPPNQPSSFIVNEHSPATCSGVDGPEASGGQKLMKVLLPAEVDEATMDGFQSEHLSPMPSHLEVEITDNEEKGGTGSVKRPSTASSGGKQKVFGTSETETKAIDFMPSYFSASVARRSSSASQGSSMPLCFMHTGSDSRASQSTRLSMMKQVEETEKDPSQAEFGVLSPVGLPRLCWDAVSCACLVFELWATPFQLVFLPDDLEMPASLNLLMMLVTGFFIADIFLNFTTGYITGSKTIMQRSLITRNYMRAWFWIDLASAFPFDLILGNVCALNSLIRVVKAPYAFRRLRYLRMMRALRLMRMTPKVHHLRDQSELLATVVKYMLRLLLALALSVGLAHLHGCFWAILNEVTVHSLGEAFRYYCRSLWWAYMMLATGSNATGDVAEKTSVWLLEMLMATERLLLGSFAVTWCVFQVMMNCQEEAQYMRLKEDTLKYLKCHGVSFKTQLQVLYRTQEIMSALTVQRHFAEYASDLPEELRRKICDEMWTSWLLSLGLLVHMASWDETLIQELALIVREETFASKSIVFTEGNASIAAYCVMYGRIAIITTLTNVHIPDFVQGTWVGEKALLNPELPRSATAIARVISSLLAVPADGFQQLLSHMNLEERFNHFCEEHVWKGLCGRCGVVGDHFTDQCPQQQISWRKRLGLTSIVERQSRITEKLNSQTRMTLMKMSSVVPQVGECVSAASNQRWLPGWMQKAVGTAQNPSKDIVATYETQMGRDLKEFLRENQLERIVPSLQRLGINSTKELMERENAEDALIEDMAAHESEFGPGSAILSEAEKSAVSKDSVQRFRRRLFGGMSKVFSSNAGMKSQHFLFLSHYKMEAGTEAALMRSELEQLMADDSNQICKSFDVPIFLDSEDLNDLTNLQERVKKSHNIALLLTAGVLSRPWVLVEMITATREKCQILPVEVFKPGARFQYPDDAFYKDLTEGKILDDAGMQVLDDCGIDITELESALRKVFKRIAVPYSPHRSKDIRQAELKALLKGCRVKNLKNYEEAGAPESPRGRPSQAMRGNATGTSSTSSPERFMERTASSPERTNELRGQSKVSSSIFCFD